MIWGGIHPIIQPEDAILADVNAICTGEGEFAFEEFLDNFKHDRDYTNTKNFWFKPNGHGHSNGNGDQLIKNHFLPLMTVQEMEKLPFPQYGAETEKIYLPGHGFVKMGAEDYLLNDGLGYTTLWSIGCPFHCSYCGNTKFIANDAKYKRIRHPSARYMVDQVKDARARFPHLSQVSFHDDSFMAIPYGQLEEFAELWHDELKLPFAVYGVIPNYVRQDKFELLSWAGMNRVRMGIQSGSKNMLDFYKRPTPPEKILKAGEVIASFAPKYHIPSAYDIIMDNPIETRDDVKSTLQLLYMMDRPYTLFIYSLKVIPNTGLAAAMEERGVDLEEIDDSYLVDPAALGEHHAVPHRALAPAAVAVEPAHGPRTREQRAAEALPAARPRSCGRCTSPSACSATCASWTSRSRRARRATTPGRSASSACGRSASRAGRRALSARRSNAVPDVTVGVTVISPDGVRNE